MVHSFLSNFPSKREKRLLALCKNKVDSNPENKTWNESAIHYLVKKLKKNPDLLDELERAISQEAPNTKCILLPKTLDNRLLVTHRKGLPQVVYCKLWRWPDLQSHHQIRSIPGCESYTGSSGGSGESGGDCSLVVGPGQGDQVPGNSCGNASGASDIAAGSIVRQDQLSDGIDSDARTSGAIIQQRVSVKSSASSSLQLIVCVNPYHYERKRPVPLATVLVPCPRIPPDLSTSFEDSEPHGGTRCSFQDTTRAPLSTLSTSTGATIRSLMTSTVSQSIPAPIGAYQNHQEIATPYSLQYQTNQGSQQMQQSDQMHLEYEQNMPMSVSGPMIETPASYTPQEQPQHIQHQVIGDPISHSVVKQQAPSPSVSQTQQPSSQQAQQHSPQQTSQNQQQQQQQQPPPPPPDQHQYSSQGGTLGHSFQQPDQFVHPESPLMPRRQINSTHEIIRPFQFKQNKFAHLARSMHEHPRSSFYHPSYDPHGYVTRPYNNNNDWQTQSRLVQQVPQQQTQQQPRATSSAPLGYSQQTSAPYHQDQPPQTQVGPPTHQVGGYNDQQQQPDLYSQPYINDPNSQQQQMQLEYQLDVPMSVAGPSGGSYTTYTTTNQCGGNLMGPPMQPSIEQQEVCTEFFEVPYSEGSRWCSISYHEFDQRIGEKYQPTSYNVCVDGYTHPLCSNRFCLGGISNPNRNEFTEWVRRRIGRGVRFTYVDGEVHVECLSDSVVFVSCPLAGANMEKGHHEMVSKLVTGVSVRAFSNPEFSRMLSAAVPKGFEEVYKMTNLCVIRVSFAKGWGRNYKRQSVLRTPCWIELQLNGPLQWIDKVLRQMRPPQSCGSTS